MSLFNRIRWFKSPKYNIHVPRNIRICALQWMLLDEEEINIFFVLQMVGVCFQTISMAWQLYNMYSRVHPIRFTIDVASLKNFYLSFAEIFFILWILFQTMWDYDAIRYLIYIYQKPKYFENEIRYWETENAFLTHFVIIIY